VPIAHHIHEDLGLLVVVHVGAVPDDAFLDRYRGLFSSTAFDPACDRLVDLRQADSRHRSPGALRQLAELLAELLAKKHEWLEIPDDRWVGALPASDPLAPASCSVLSRN